MQLALGRLATLSTESDLGRAGPPQRPPQCRACCSMLPAGRSGACQMRCKHAGMPLHPSHLSADLEIAKRPDGSDWVLGSGGFGKVGRPSARFGLDFLCAGACLHSVHLLGIGPSPGSVHKPSALCVEHKWMCVDSRLCPLPAAPLDPGVQGAAARRAARGGQDHSCEERWLSVHLVAALDPCAQVHAAPMWVGPSHWMSRDRTAHCIACSIQMNRSGGTSTRRRWQPRAWRLRCCGRAGTPTLCSFRWGRNFPNLTAFGKLSVAALAFRTLGIVWRWCCGRARAHTLCGFG